MYDYFNCSVLMTSGTHAHTYTSKELGMAHENRWINRHSKTLNLSYIRIRYGHTKTGCGWGGCSK
jgi:hypothetical protein